MLTMQIPAMMLKARDLNGSQLGRDSMAAEANSLWLLHIGSVSILATSMHACEGSNLLRFLMYPSFQTKASQY